MKVTAVRAENLSVPQAAGARTLDPYLVLSLDEHVIGRTTSRHKAVASPEFDEAFETSAHRAHSIEIVALSRSVVGDGVFLASIRVPLEDCIEGAGGADSLWVGAGGDIEQMGEWRGKSGEWWERRGGG